MKNKHLSTSKCGKTYKMVPKPHIRQDESRLTKYKTNKDRKKVSKIQWNKQEWENTKEHGKKYENKDELKEDIAEFYEDIFKYRPRKANKNINTFLGDLKDHPEVLAKKLTELEKSEADK